ncbi:regulation of G-protein function [Scheffersomyces amazonensis]|uniref:regulation of G-protein function n=1 Tax=Scheffersomyces amazonensis TaxID=1078765 RepID=UPI00315CDF12
MSSYTFSWPKGPQEVILTGTFDNWSKSFPLVKETDGSFSLTVPLPKSSEPILYKYVVDGEWLVSSTQRISKDESGNENNVLEESDLVEAKSSGSAIPEAGGLVAATGVGAAAVAAAATPKDDVKTTVLPSTEGIQTTLGEPGIHVPKDPEALAAFEQVRDVDPKTLNEPELTAEEKKKQKKKVKRSQYKAKKKKKATATDGTTVEGSTEGETTEEQTPEPTTKEEEEVAAGTAGVAAVGAGAAAVAVASEKETAPEAVPETKEVVSEPVVPEDAPEPVPETKEVAPEVVPEVIPEAVPETKEVVPEPVVPEVKEATEEAPKTLDPKSDAPVETPAVSNGEAAVEKEVDASPLVKSPKKAKNYESDEEIVIAQGTVDKDAITAAVVAQEGDVTLEEMNLTEAEKAKLTEEANIPTKTATPAPAKTAPAKAKASTTSSSAKEDKKKKEKKPNFIVRFFRKL